jgi:hypothetical protein
VTDPKNSDFLWTYDRSSSRHINNQLTLVGVTVGSLVGAREGAKVGMRVGIEVGSAVGVCRTNYNT